MKCFIVFYFVTIQFVFGIRSSEYCPFEEMYGTINPDEEVRFCGTQHRKYPLDFIPPISGFILRIHMYNQKIVQLPFNAFRNLSSQYNVSTIKLSHCKVRDIDAGAFLNLHNLTSLSLDANDIHCVDSKTFQHLPKLTSIYLDKNQIELLPKGLFRNLPLLYIVSLSLNQIRHIEADTFANTSLWILRLDSNKLQSLDVSFKESISNGTLLCLDGNPWMCDCNLIDLYDLYTSLETYSIMYSFEPVCENPPAIRGKSWADLTWHQFICDPRVEILLNETTVILSEVYNSAKNEVQDTTEFSDDQQDDNIYLTVYSRKKNKLLDAIKFSDDQQDDKITIKVYNGTKYQQVDTGIPQPLSIPYTILYLALVCVTAFIIGLVFVVRHTLVKSNRRCHFWLPTIVKRRSVRRTNTRNTDNDILMSVVQSKAVSKNTDAESSTDDVDEEQTSISN